MNMSRRFYKFFTFQVEERKDYAKQAIESGQLYMAPYSRQSAINDDREGHYLLSRDVDAELREKLRMEKQKICICSVACHLRSHYMWTEFVSESPKRICISIEPKIIDSNVRGKIVKYIENLPHISFNQFMTHKPIELANKILQYKRFDRYAKEDEFRFMKSIEDVNSQAYLDVIIHCVYLSWELNPAEVAYWREIAEARGIKVVQLRKSI